MKQIDFLANAEWEPPSVTVHEWVCTWGHHSHPCNNDIPDRQQCTWDLLNVVGVLLWLPPSFIDFGWELNVGHWFWLRIKFWLSLLFAWNCFHVSPWHICNSTKISSTSKAKLEHSGKQEDTKPVKAIYTCVIGCSAVLRLKGLMIKHRNQRITLWFLLKSFGFFKFILRGPGFH